MRRWSGLAALPLGLAALAAVAAWWPWDPGASLPAFVFVSLVALAVVAGVHAPLGGRSLGLGAGALPMAVGFFGPAAAAGLGGMVFSLCELARRGMSTHRLQDRAAWLADRAGRLGQVILSCLAAAAAFRLASGGAGIDSSLARRLGPAVLAAVVYVALLVALDLAAAWAADRRLRWQVAVPPLAVDLAGWAVGLVLARVAESLGWQPALALYAAVALVSLEAARVARLRGRAERRVRELREATLAGHRIIFRNPDLLSIAEQIHQECRWVLPFEWFQFELLGEGNGGRSWYAGPEREVLEGAPRPPAAPPTLPGIHRSAQWKIVEREFGTDDEIIARLRLWCDPRRLERGSLELLESLLPQMASSVQRALLDRVAKRDPLTDLPDRRAFESHLERVFRSSGREGTPMAVVLCDVDSFKRINDLGGHAVGDKALLVIARLLENQRREEDFCCRFGGDEFAVVLERADGQTALTIAERIRVAVARRKRSDLKTRIPLRLTAGVAAFPEIPVREARELVELADEAMYEAKRRGRNRCLLNLGRGRFLQPGGDVVGNGRASKVKPPTLFA